MTVNTNAYIVTVTATTYPADPQVIFGSPRHVAMVNDDQNSTIWISFDGVQDAARLKPAAGFADVGVEFDGLYTQVWLRLDAGSAGGSPEVQVAGEEVI